MTNITRVTLLTLSLLASASACASSTQVRPGAGAPVAATEATQAPKAGNPVTIGVAKSATDVSSSFGANATGDIRPITVGSTQRSTLDDGDRETPEGLKHELWTVELRAGETVIVTARSREFDTRLGIIYQDDDDSFAENDDMEAGTTDSQIRYTARHAGQHRIVVASYSAEGRGAYTLELTAPGQMQRLLGASGANATLSVPTTVNGRLRQTELRHQGSYVDRYVLQMRAGQVLRVSVLSSEFTPVLSAGELGGEEIKVDVEAGSRGYSQLTLNGSEATTVILLVHAMTPGETGAYRLSVAQPTRLEPTERSGGLLTRSDLSLNDGTFADVFYVDWREGDEIRVTLESLDFHPHLMIFGPDNELVAESDGPSANGNSAEVERTVRRAGQYTILVTAFDRDRGDGLGGYHLRTWRNDVPRPPAGTRVLTVGERVSGEITASDPQNCGTNTECDLYAMDLRAGERITVIVTSESSNLKADLSFRDARLMWVWGPDADDRFERFERTIAIQQSGRYWLGVIGTTGFNLGRYQLEVRRAP